MENLLIQPTDRTPFVSLDATTGQFEIAGSSIPEDCLVFYEKIFSWLDEYVTMPAAQTTIDLKMDYFNTSSSKSLYMILKRLEKVKDLGRGVQANWHYSLKDTDMFETGNDFMNLVNIPFKLIQY